MKRIQIASLSRRLISSFIDLAIIAGITCLFYFCVFEKAVANIQHFDELNQKIKTEQLNSKLYIEKDGKVITVLLNDISIQKETDMTKLNNFHEIIHHFYTDYLRNKTIIKSPDDKITHTEYWYGVHILHLEDVRKVYETENLPKYEGVLFHWIDEPKGKEDLNAKYALNSDVKPEAYRDFLIPSFGSATYALMHSSDVNRCVNTIAWGKVRAVVYSSLIATLIPCLIIPLILPNGKTIGKLCTKLIVLTDDGYYYKRYKYIFRYLAFYIVELFGAFVTVGLTLLFSTCMALFSRKRRALHDYIAFSVVIDETHSVFFKDKIEEAEFKKQHEALINKNKNKNIAKTS